MNLTAHCFSVSSVRKGCEIQLENEVQRLALLERARAAVCANQHALVLGGLKVHTAPAFVAPGLRQSQRAERDSRYSPVAKEVVGVLETQHQARVHIAQPETILALLYIPFPVHFRRAAAALFLQAHEVAGGVSRKGTSPRVFQLTSRLGKQAHAHPSPEPV